MITIDEIRKYNIPDAIPEQHIQEHLRTAELERKRRLGSATYSGTDYTDEYDLIHLHLTLKRIYEYEHIFFISGIPETTDDKLNARSFTRDEVRELAMNEERKAAEFIQLILAEADAVDGIKTVGKYTFASIGGNPDYKTEKTRLR